MMLGWQAGVVACHEVKLRDAAFSFTLPISVSKCRTQVLEYNIASHKPEFLQLDIVDILGQLLLEDPHQHRLERPQEYILEGSHDSLVGIGISQCIAGEARRVVSERCGVLVQQKIQNKLLSVESPAEVK